MSTVIDRLKANFDFDAFSNIELFEALFIADNAYYNEDDPLFADSEYDALLRYCRTADPTNTYFLGVGSAVRGGKERLPVPMGSLTQIYFGDFDKWCDQHNIAELIISEKLDGNSGLIVYGPTGKFQKSYSRGNGIEGADTSRLVGKLDSVPQSVGRPMTVRGELIFAKADWPTVQSTITRSGGQSYKNARNAVSGLLNSKSAADELVHRYLKFVAYEIVGSDLGKAEQLFQLEKLGFSVPKFQQMFRASLDDDVLTQLVNYYRDESDYEIDGIVIDVNVAKERKRINPSKETLNPEYARKFKIAGDDNTAVTEVIGVEWAVSKNGYVKPRVNFKPVELVGATIQYTTGFNAGFIRDNQIGPGAKVRITRAGDVIPYLQEVVSPMASDDYAKWLDAELQQFGDYEWTETGIDAVVTSLDSPAVRTEQLIDFCSKMGFEHVGPGNVAAIYEWFTENYKGKVELGAGNFVTLSVDEMTLALNSSTTAKKIRASIEKVLSNTTWWALAGSWPGFGRGVGRKRMKLLFNAFKGDVRLLADFNSIVAVDGFEAKTAKKIVDNADDFISWLGHAIQAKVVTLADYVEQSGGALSGNAFVFTGFRDKGLESLIEKAGGKVSTSVSKKTTYVVAADVNETGGKLNKARELGVQILSADQLKALLK